MAGTGNPALSGQSFAGFPAPRDAADRFTVTGTLEKTGLLFVGLLAGAAWPAWLVRQGSADELQTLAWIGIVGSAVLALAIIVKRPWAGALGLPYALLEGLSLGAISLLAEQRFPGIVRQAVAGTFTVFAASLLVYRTGWIPVTRRFRFGVAIATLGILLLYLATLVLRLAGMEMPYIHEATPVGIAFSVGVITVAALNLLLDYDFIERAARRGAGGGAEWFAAFGLIITLVWLYFSVLRLASKVRSLR